MFLKQEKPEMDDFEEIKFGSKRKKKCQYFKKIFWKFPIFFNGYPCKNSKIVSEHSACLKKGV